MRENVLRKKIEAGQPTLGTRLVCPWPSLFEIIGRLPQFDYIEFSGEYSTFDLDDLDNIARACELVGTSSMIKVDQSVQTFLAQRALGSGFQSVLFTDIRTVEDARDCVRAVRAETPQTGGINPAYLRRNVGYIQEGGSEAYVRAMEDIVVVLMIEKKSAVDNLEEILAVGGVDMVQFGPADYSMSIGLPGQRARPEVKEAEEHVIRTAQEMGVVPRAEIYSPEEAHSYLERGVRHFNIGMDIGILFNWLNEKGSALAGILEGF